MGNRTGLRRLQGVFVALALALAAVMGLRALRKQGPTAPPPMSVEGVVPVPLPELERTALVLKDGRLHSATGLYTGLMLEHYPDGGLKSRSSISNGLLEGASEGWFTNRVRQIEEHFVQGVAHGERTRWDEQGHKVASATVVEGRIEGTFRRWHGNGVVSEEMTLRRGEPAGLARAWYPSGFLQAEVWMVDGKPREQRRYKDGERPGDAPSSVGPGQ